MFRKLSDSLTPAAFLVKSDVSSLGNGSTRHSMSPLHRASTSTPGNHSPSFANEALHAAIDKANELCGRVVDEVFISV